MTRSLLPSRLSVVVLCMSMTGMAHGQIVIDDFESYALGDINGVGGWTVNNATGEVAVDPLDATNQVLFTTGGAKRIFKALGANAIAEGDDSKVLSFRGMWAADFADTGAGLTQLTSPTGFGDYATQMRGHETTGPVGGPSLDVNDGGSFVHVADLAFNVWYDLSYSVRQSTDTFDLTISGGGLVSPVTYSNAGFRNTAAGALESFFIASGNGGTAAFYVDDITVIPEPATITMLFLGGLMALGLLRRPS